MNTNLKTDIALFTEVMQAGFTLSNIQSINTDDGSCWSTVLCFEKKKVLRASNGGFGGPDEIEQLVVKGGRFRDVTPAKPYVARLLAIPGVAKYVRDYEVDLEQSCWDYAVERVHKERATEGGTQTVEQVREELEAASKQKVEDILTKPINADEETVGMIIGHLTDTKSEIGRMKRACKTKLVWFKKGKNFTEYVSLNIPDSPANRVRAEAKYSVEMEGYVNDLVAAF